MVGPVLAVLLAVTAPSTPPPTTGLDVHIAPNDVAGDFQAKMLELSG